MTEQFRQYQPDVAVVDLRMLEMDGVVAITTIRAEFPDACFVMLTIYGRDQAIFQRFRREVQSLSG